MLNFLYKLMTRHVALINCAAQLADGELKKYLEDHVKEELGHDDIFRKDLEKLGANTEIDFLEVAQMIGMQYFLIHDKGPYMLLGYMYALEKDSLSDDQIDEMEKLVGGRLECVRMHAKLDPHHADELLDQINDLDDEKRKLVFENFHATRNHINGICAGFDKWVY